MCVLGVRGISDSFPRYSKKESDLSRRRINESFRTRGWRTKGKGMCTGEKTEERNYEKKEKREAVAGELAVWCVPWIRGNAPSHASNMQSLNIQRVGGVWVS